MLWRDTVELISITTTENEMGDPVQTETPRTVFANKKSIRQSEFYQAMATDLKPEIMFEVRSDEYQGETKLRYDGKGYTIIRTYTKNDEIMELVCQGTVVN